MIFVCWIEWILMDFETGVEEGFEGGNEAVQEDDEEERRWWSFEAL